MIRLHAFFIAALLLVIGSGAAWAACTYPESVDLPDGSTASEDEMLAGKRRVEAYLAEMEEYLKCLDQELAALGEEVTDEQRVMTNTRYNAAVDAMYEVSNAFNEQIRLYKAENDE